MAHLLNALQDIGLEVLITVGTNAQIQLLRIIASLESLRDTQNWIRGSGLHMIEATGLHHNTGWGDPSCGDASTLQDNQGLASKT